MPNLFEEASKATEELFNEQTPEPAEDTAVPEETPIAEEETQPAETPTDGDPIDEVEEQQALMDDAVQTAETAAQAAAEKDAQLQQIMQELEMARQQTASMQATIDELSRKNEENIIEEVLEPPVLDIGSLAFADEDTIREAQTQYAQQMADYNRQSFMKEFAPVIEQANEAKYNKEKSDLMSVFSQIPELSGIEDMMPQVEKIIRNNRVLSSDDIPLPEKLITAFMIARGVNATNTPPEDAKEPSIEDMMAIYESNPEFQDRVEKQRIDKLKNSQQVPPFSASSGAVNAALDIKEEPKGWDDASDRTRKMFGLV